MRFMCLFEEELSAVSDEPDPLLQAAWWQSLRLEISKCTFRALMQAAGKVHKLCRIKDGNLMDCVHAAYKSCGARETVWARAPGLMAPPASPSCAGSVGAQPCCRGVP